MGSLIADGELVDIYGPYTQVPTKFGQDLVKRVMLKIELTPSITIDGYLHHLPIDCTCLNDYQILFLLRV